MHKSNHASRRLLLLLLAMAAAVPGAPAFAGAFAGAGSADLRLLTVTGGDLGGLVITRTPWEQSGARAGASTDTWAEEVRDDPNPVQQRVGSQAGGSGDTDANAEAGIRVELSNGSNDALSVAFEWSWALAVSVAGPGDAWAEALLDLFVDGVVTDGDGDVSRTLTADRALGIEGTSDSGTGAFRVTLLPGDQASVDLVTSVAGLAQVPVPPVLSLFAIGLALLRWRRP